MGICFFDKNSDTVWSAYHVLKFEGAFLEGLEGAFFRGGVLKVGRKYRRTKDESRHHSRLEPRAELSIFLQSNNLFRNQTF